MFLKFSTISQTVGGSNTQNFPEIDMLAITLKAFLCLAFEFDKLNIVCSAEINAHDCIIVCESVLWMPSMS